MPPIGAPNWCLNTEALRKLGRSTDNIPNYDPEGEGDDNVEDRLLDYNDIDDEGDDHDSTAKSSKKKKKKSRSKKQHKTKKSKAKK
jgi:hypothetical protein